MAKVVLWQVKSTDMAYLFSTFQKGDKNAKQVWIPRSQINHVTRQPAEVGGWQKCIVDMADWLIDKHSL